MALVIGIQIYLEMLPWVRKLLKMNLTELCSELETTVLGLETGIQTEPLSHEMNGCDSHKLQLRE